MEMGNVVLLPLREAAQRIGVSKTTLQKQARKGVLRAILIGNQWLVTPEEADRYAHEHKGKQGRPRKNPDSVPPLPI